jgi:hypothetical protein
MIRFSCPRCHKVHKAKDRAAGRTIYCPACGQKLQIPASNTAIVKREPDSDTEEITDDYEDQESTATIPKQATTPKQATSPIWSAISLTLGGLSVLGGCITLPWYGGGFVLTLPLSLAGLVFAVLALQKEKGVPAVIALVLNIVAVAAGFVLVLIWWAVTYGPLNPWRRWH